MLEAYMLGRAGRGHGKGIGEHLIVGEHVGVEQHDGQATRRRDRGQVEMRKDIALTVESRICRRSPRRASNNRE